MIVPEFDMPDMPLLLAVLIRNCLVGGEGRWKDFTFHPCKEETFRFISDVLDELITLFPLLIFILEVMKYILVIRNGLQIHKYSSSSKINN